MNANEAECSCWNERNWIDRHCDHQKIFKELQQKELEKEKSQKQLFSSKMRWIFLLCCKLRKNNMKEWWSSIMWECVDLTSDIKCHESIRNECEIKDDCHECCYTWHQDHCWLTELEKWCQIWLFLTVS